MYLNVAVDRHARPPGQLVSKSDVRSVVGVFVAIDAAIARQEALALDDKPLVEIPSDRLAELLPLYERMGVHQ